MSEHLQYRSEYLKRVGNVNDSLKFFFSQYEKISVHERNILELGTKRWYQHPTHHKDYLSPWTTYCMSDVEKGTDVDIVSDAHSLSSTFKEETFTVVWASSVFEHLHSPWVSAEEILKVLKPGGIFFIQTHLCFPEHSYPHDYFRFTRQGLERLFKNAAQKVSCYDYPAKLLPENKEIDWNHAAPNFLNVNIAGIK